MKRHTRPYGCTFPRCHKVFGSKNDWKRHENSQHFQQEMWRCSELASGTPDGKCGYVAYNQTTFVDHLKNSHSINDAAQQDQCKQNCRIGRSGNTRFWCGFCREILPVRVQILGQAAWDERFNHIDSEHYKRGQRIDDWLCIEMKRTKGETEGLGKRSRMSVSSASDVRMEGDEGSEEGDASQPFEIEPMSSDMMQSESVQRPRYRQAWKVYCVSHPHPSSRRDANLTFSASVVTVRTIPFLI